MRVGGGRIVHKSRRAKKKNYIPLNINQRTIFHFWHGLMSFYTHAILSMKVIQCATRALWHWGWLWGNLQGRRFKVAPLKPEPI